MGSEGEKGLIGRNFFAAAFKTGVSRGKNACHEKSFPNVEWYRRCFIGVLWLALFSYVLVHYISSSLAAVRSFSFDIAELKLLLRERYDRIIALMSIWCFVFCRSHAQFEPIFRSNWPGDLNHEIRVVRRGVRGVRINHDRNTRPECARAYRHSTRVSLIAYTSTR